MRFAIFAITAAIAVSYVTESAVARIGGVNSGPYNTSAMAVMRERQERVRKCSALLNFDYDTMSFQTASGRRQKCP